MPLTGEQGFFPLKTNQQLRKVRADPPSPEPRAKRRCLSNDANDAAAAELLLGLSHSPRSSPRDSNASDEDVLRLSPSLNHEAVSKTEESLSARRSRRVGRQPLKLLSAESEDEDDASEESLSGHSAAKAPFKQLTAAKEVPARCKCGKRVSASHPPCKSELMLLSEKFRDRFATSAGEGNESRIDLNDCALALGVPRRRLYDITIVYEAAEVVRRTGKLAYVWQGLEHLPELIERLKKEEESGQPVGDRRGNMHCAASDQQNTHSLWTLSRKFIRMLLTRKGVIQLSDAAVHLIGEREGVRPQTYLTVERRLYDIGSILSTLDLIKRTYIEGKRQPAFSWNWSGSTSGHSGDPQQGFALLEPETPNSIDKEASTIHRPHAKAASVNLRDNRVHDLNKSSPDQHRSRTPEQQVCSMAQTGQGFSQALASFRPSETIEGHFHLPIQSQGPLQWSSLLVPSGMQLSQPPVYSTSLAQTALLHFLQQCSAAGKPCQVSECHLSPPSGFE